MLKKLFTTLFCLLFIIQAFAQYKIELNNIHKGNLHYMKMGNPGPKGKEIRINNLYWEQNGTPQLPVMGEFHYNRTDSRYWRESLMKMKASGINIVSTYILWILHEEFEGRQNWTGNNDLRKFVQLCKDLDLKVHLRVGPYCNAEIRNGGFPDWIEHNRNFRPRTNDPLYLEYVKYWYKSIFSQVHDLLYKDNGPIVAVQLENEFVTEGLVVPHIMALKKIAVNAGFDVPIYSMTHWMMSDYPKGEVVPYAGYYLETPWISYGDKENPTTPQEFFSYNRISDNIGNDFIKTSTKVESLEGEGNDSPYFTCENGLGTPNYYMRRAVVPEEMAGENINLRLGCGVNLMGYYMYVGQTNPNGEQYTLGRATADISNDYQAPIKEFGNLGVVMKETKKMNFFMNDFGPIIAPMRAYLPISNKKRENLQWAVRTDGERGFVFCSNYLYKHTRKNYKNVQFEIELNKESIKIPRKKTTIFNGTYFFWPFNMEMNGICLKYATAQPICKMNENNTDYYFFFADDQVPAEFLFKSDEIKDIYVNNGKLNKEKGRYFVNQLTAGKDCNIELTENNGKKVKIILLTEKESDQIWKGKLNNKDYVALTESTLLSDNHSLYIASENSSQTIEFYENGQFVNQKFNSPEYVASSSFTAISPLKDAQWIKPKKGNKVQRNFNGKSLSNVVKALIRFKSESKTKVIINGEEIPYKSFNEYNLADITKIYKNGINNICFENEQAQKGVIAEAEIILENGTRWLWNTDHLWTEENGRQPVDELEKQDKPTSFAPDEHLAVYEIQVPENIDSEISTRLYINFTGDIAKAYIGSRLIHDVFNNGTSWIIGLNRYSHLLDKDHKLTIRIDGLKSADTPIYFEKNVSKKECVNPVIKSINIKRENYIKLNYN